MAYLIDPERVPKDFMGIIRADVLLENTEDRALVERGLMREGDLRSTLSTGIVDTGARMLLLPEDVVDHLGLTRRRTTGVRYADGRRADLPVAGPVTITIQNRTMISECLVGPQASAMLIGQIELERLDLVANCADRTLMPNPASPDRPLLPV